MPVNFTVGITPEQQMAQQQQHAAQFGYAPPALGQRPNYIPGTQGQPGTIAPQPVFDPNAVLQQRQAQIQQQGISRQPSIEPIANVYNNMNLPPGSANNSPQLQVQQQNALGGNGQGQQRPFQANAPVQNPFANNLGNLSQLAFNPGASIAPVPAPPAPAGQMYNNQQPFFRPPGTPSVENLANGGSFLNAPIYTPQQQGNFGNLQDLAAQKFANPYAGFEPIEQQARADYRRGISSLAERFTALGGGQRSGAFERALSQSEREFGRNLAQLRGQYGRETEQQAHQLLNTGLTPLYNQQYTEPFSAGNAVAQIAAPVMDAAVRLLGPAAAGSLATMAAGGTLGASAKTALASSLGLAKGATIGSILAALAPIGLVGVAALGTAYGLYDILNEDDSPRGPSSSSKTAQSLTQQAQHAQQNPSAVPSLSPGALTAAQANNIQFPQAPAPVSNPTQNAPLNLPVHPVQFQPVREAAPVPAALPRNTGTQITGAKRNEANPIIRQDMARHEGTAYPTHVYFKNAPNTPVPSPEMNPNVYGGSQKEQHARIMAQAQREGVSPNDPAFRAARIAEAQERGQEYNRLLQQRGADIAARVLNGEISPARGIAEQYAQSIGGHTIVQAPARMPRERRRL